MVLECPFEVPLISASPSCIFESTQWILKKVFQTPKWVSILSNLQTVMWRSKWALCTWRLRWFASLLPAGTNLSWRWQFNIQLPTHTPFLAHTRAWAHAVTHCYSSILTSETISFPGFDCSTKSRVTHTAAFQRRHYTNNQFVWQQNNCSLDRQIYYN